MSDKFAKTYNLASNRAIKQKAPEKKVIFRGVLDNAFRVQWPSVPMNVQKAALACLTSLDGISSGDGCLRKIYLKRKRKGISRDPATKRQRTNSQQESKTVELAPTEKIATVSKHVVVGINEVTRQLETHIHSLKNTLKISAYDTGATQPDPRSYLKVVFVCRADVNPPILVDHIPHLVTAFNSVRTSPTMLLVPLPEGAEAALAAILGLRRAAVLGLASSYPGLATVLSRLESVPTLTSHWLQVEANTQLVPTHIKQLKTSAPKDMKAAKECRTKEKAEAKLRGTNQDGSQHVG